MGRNFGQSSMLSSLSHSVEHPGRGPLGEGGPELGDENINIVDTDDAFDIPNMHTLPPVSRRRSGRIAKLEQDAVGLSSGPASKAQHASSKAAGPAFHPAQAGATKEAFGREGAAVGADSASAGQRNSDTSRAGGAADSVTPTTSRSRRKPSQVRRRIINEGSGVLASPPRVTRGSTLPSPPEKHPSTPASASPAEGGHGGRTDGDDDIDVDIIDGENPTVESLRQLATTSVGNGAVSPQGVVGYYEHDGYLGSPLTLLEPPEPAGDEQTRDIGPLAGGPGPELRARRTRPQSGRRVILSDESGEDTDADVHPGKRRRGALPAKGPPLLSASSGTSLEPSISDSEPSISDSDVEDEEDFDPKDSLGPRPRTQLRKRRGVSPQEDGGRKRRRLGKGGTQSSASGITSLATSRALKERNSKRRAAGGGVEEEGLGGGGERRSPAALGGRHEEGPVLEVAPLRSTWQDRRLQRNTHGTTPQPLGKAAAGDSRDTDANALQRKLQREKALLERQNRLAGASEEDRERIAQRIAELEAQMAERTAELEGQAAQRSAQVAQLVGQAAQPVGQVAQPVGQVAQPLAELEGHVAAYSGMENGQQVAEEDEEEEWGAWDVPPGPWPLDSLTGACISYVDEKGRIQGPFRLRDIEAMHAAELITPKTQLRHVDFGKGPLARSLPHLAPAPPQPPHASGDRNRDPQASARARSRSRDPRERSRSRNGRMRSRSRSRSRDPRSRSRSRKGHRRSRSRSRDRAPHARSGRSPARRAASKSRSPPRWAGGPRRWGTPGRDGAGRGGRGGRGAPRVETPEEREARLASQKEWEERRRRMASDFVLSIQEQVLMEEVQSDEEGEWTCRLNSGKDGGPFTLNQLRGAFASGQIGLNTMVHDEEEGVSIRLRHLIKDLVPPASTQLPAQLPASAQLPAQPPVASTQFPAQPPAFMQLHARPPPASNVVMSWPNAAASTQSTVWTPTGVPESAAEPDSPQRPALDYTFDDDEDQTHHSPSPPTWPGGLRAHPTPRPPPPPPPHMGVLSHGVPQMPAQQPYVPHMQGQQPYVPHMPAQHPYVSHMPAQQAYVPHMPAQQAYVPHMPAQQPYVSHMPAQQPYVPHMPGQQSHAPHMPGQQPHVRDNSNPLPGPAHAGDSLPAVCPDGESQNPPWEAASDHDGERQKRTWEAASDRDGENRNGARETASAADGENHNPAWETATNPDAENQNPAWETATDLDGKKGHCAWETASDDADEHQNRTWEAPSDDGNESQNHLWEAASDRDDQHQNPTWKTASDRGGEDRNPAWERVSDPPLPSPPSHPPAPFEMGRGTAQPPGVTANGGVAHDFDTQQEVAEGFDGHYARSSPTPPVPASPLPPPMPQSTPPKAPRHDGGRNRPGPVPHALPGHSPAIPARWDPLVEPSPEVPAVQWSPAPPVPHSPTPPPPFSPPPAGWITVGASAPSEAGRSVPQPPAPDVAVQPYGSTALQVQSSDPWAGVPASPAPPLPEGFVPPVPPSPVPHSPVRASHVQGGGWTTVSPTTAEPVLAGALQGSDAFFSAQFESLAKLLMPEPPSDAPPLPPDSPRPTALPIQAHATPPPPPDLPAPTPLPNQAQRTATANPAPPSPLLTQPPLPDDTVAVGQPGDGGRSQPAQAEPSPRAMQALPATWDWVNSESAPAPPLPNDAGGPLPGSQRSNHQQSELPSLEVGTHGEPGGVTEVYGNGSNASRVTDMYGNASGATRADAVVAEVAPPPPHDAAGEIKPGDGAANPGWPPGPSGSAGQVSAPVGAPWATAAAGAQGGQPPWAIQPDGGVNAWRQEMSHAGHAHASQGMAYYDGQTPGSHGYPNQAQVPYAAAHPPQPQSGASASQWPPHPQQGQQPPGWAPAPANVPHTGFPNQAYSHVAHSMPSQGHAPASREPPHGPSLYPPASHAPHGQAYPLAPGNQVQWPASAYPKSGGLAPTYAPHSSGAPGLAALPRLAPRPTLPSHPVAPTMVRPTPVTLNPHAGYPQALPPLRANPAPTSGWHAPAGPSNIQGLPRGPSWPGQAANPPAPAHTWGGRGTLAWGQPGQRPHFTLQHGVGVFLARPHGPWQVAPQAGRGVTGHAPQTHGHR